MFLLKCQVLSNEQLLPRTYLMWLEAPQVASSVRPGQFAMLRCHDDLVRVLRRPLSIHAVDGDRVAFLYRAIGAGTRWLANRRRGDEIDMLGPLGNGFSITGRSRRLLLLAGGIGLAPLKFLAESAASQGHQVVLLVGTRNTAEQYPIDLLPSHGHVVKITEDGSAGKKGLVTDFISEFAPEVDQAFACGPEGMYRELMRVRGSMQSVPVQVSLEVRMGCGIGACLSCTIRTNSGLKHVCKDGPVFDLDDIDWGAAPVCRI
ncbi:MAG: dihydroorotate dehydrogenase electron transfer subunit [Chloroflexi bacterium]|nr:dihydroorotate dehydrogenase electron transfer subunit [Chloroflexota bacterium]